MVMAMDKNKDKSDFTINVNSPGNFFANEITFEAPVYIGGQGNEQTVNNGNMIHEKNVGNESNEAGMAAADGSDSSPFVPAEELCRFVHPTLSGDDEMKVHDEIKKLVKRQGVQEICLYLQKMADEKKILLPQNPGVAYKELVRMGMPDGEGFGEKYFSKCYAASKR